MPMVKNKRKWFAWDWEKKRAHNLILSCLLNWGKNISTSTVGKITVTQTHTSKRCKN